MSSEFDGDARQATSDSYKAHGFEPGEAVHEFAISFTKEELERSLFGSTYSNPSVIQVNLDDYDVHLAVVVTMAKQVYTEHTQLLTDAPLGCFERPEWYLEGWLLKSGFDPYPEVVRVRAYLQVSSDGGWDLGYIQRIPTSPGQAGLIRSAL